MKTSRLRWLYNGIATLSGLFIFMSAFSTNYYVSNSGNDNSSGTSPDSAWKSIEKVNSNSYKPGDSILFQKGNIWRNETLLVSSSGSNDNQIVYGTYGSGNKPEILGSLLAESWTKVSGNIWSSATQIPLDPWAIGYDGPQIFFESNTGEVSWGSHKSYTGDYGNLLNEFDWTWNSSTIYIYSESNPNGAYSEIEVPQLPQGIRLMDNNYITIDGLLLMYFGDAAIYDEYQTIELYGLRVTNCEIAYIGQKNGGAAYGLSVHHSDSYFANNLIYNCGRRGISITLYDTDPITLSNIVIENNHFHHGWHTTSLDGSNTAGHTIKNIVFRNNLVEGDPDVVLGGENSNSNHVFMSNQSTGSGSVEDVYFYNNIFTYASGSSIKVGDMDQVYIYNNTFYNFNPSLDNWQAHAFCGSSTNVSILNNIFYNNATDNKWAAIECHTSVVDQYEVDYNLYFNTDQTRRMFWIDEGTSYAIDEWEDYRNATGNDLNSPNPENPLFANAPEDFSLTENSPALGAGISIGLIHSDYNGNAISSPPDLGAIQYGTGPASSTKETFKALQGVTVYPIPAKDYIMIELPEPDDIVLKIYNLQGALLQRNTLSQRLTPVPLQLAPGTYLLNLSNRKGETMRKQLLIL